MFLSFIVKEKIDPGTPETLIFLDSPLPPILDVSILKPLISFVSVDISISLTISFVSSTMSDLVVFT